jgi:hypothetical protein
VGLRPLACCDCGFESRWGHGCLSLVSAVCCQEAVSASGWSLVQRSPTECGVSECDGEASTMRRPWPTRGRCATGGENYWLYTNAIPHPVSRKGKSVLIKQFRGSEACERFAQRCCWRFKYSEVLTPFRHVNTDVSKKRSAFIFKVKPSKTSGLLLGHVDSEDEGTKILRNVGIYVSKRCNMPEDLNRPSLDTSACNTHIKECAVRVLNAFPQITSQNVTSDIQTALFYSPLCNFHLLSFLKWNKQRILSDHRAVCLFKLTL